MTKEYVVMLGVSYLTDYLIVEPIGNPLCRVNEVTGHVSRRGINPRIFNDKDTADWVAGALGGKVVEVKNDR